MDNFKKRVSLNIEETLDLGTILSREIRRVYKDIELYGIEVYGMDPVYDPEKLKKLYKKIMGTEWRE